MSLNREDPLEASRSPVVADSAGCLKDRELVNRCLAGDAQAWSDLYQHCHEHLLRSARLLVGKSSANSDLVEEVAARVWYSLVRNEGNLLGRFDPARGCRLTTFLAILARSEARQYFRAERRRRVREETASQHTPVHHLDDIGMRLDADDVFVGTLTPAETAYYKTVLLGEQTDGPANPYSPGNSWQLSHRVRSKLRNFLGNGAE